MSVIVHCQQCGKEESVTPTRSRSYRFCSYGCRGIWRSVNWVGENHPRWQGGERKKICQHCGDKFSIGLKQPITTFRKQKFCSKKCADVGGVRLEGERHPLFKTGARRRASRGKHGAWARAVLSRDHATCRHCGASGIELHAHHIKSFKDNPDLRWDVSNGMTLCHRCHWAVHTASNANGVNSGNILPGNAGDNPEPSLGRKPLEGVTTRGRAYRRWSGNCSWCNAFITKTWSDTVGKANLFCSKSCSGKYRAKYHPNPFGHGGNSSTSALHESDDIV